MNPVTIIAQKRDGGRLDDADIARFVAAFTSGTIPDYQMSALAMAIFFQGMDLDETTALTRAMLESGVVLSWPNFHRPLVDKHSTGGLGDKVSLILAPLLAAAGLGVPMISGRGLGPTGGTLDKLQAIPGYRVDLGLDEIQRLIAEVGCVITGASPELAPADRKLYALRDVSGTVPSIPLITGSILSKKLAEGLDALVMDVKWGSGAFMKTREQARKLANSLEEVGKRMGLAITSLLSDMNQPLGRMVGNAVEVEESLDMLRGGGPEDLCELTLRLGAELLKSTRQSPDLSTATARLRGHLVDGSALRHFERMVQAQGGDLDRLAPRAAESLVESRRPGYVGAIDTEALGWLIIELGGGRRVLSDPVDPSVGFEMLVRVGDRISRGQPLARLFAHPPQVAAAIHSFQSAIEIHDTPVAALPLFES